MIIIEFYQYSKFYECISDYFLFLIFLTFIKRIQNLTIKKLTIVLYLITCTIGKNEIGAPKMRNNFWCTIKLFIFLYCTGFFLFAPTSYSYRSSSFNITIAPELFRISGAPILFSPTICMLAKVEVL